MKPAGFVPVFSFPSMRLMQLPSSYRSGRGHSHQCVSPKQRENICSCALVFNCKASCLHLPIILYQVFFCLPIILRKRRFRDKKPYNTYYTGNENSPVNFTGRNLRKPILIMNNWIFHIYCSAMFISPPCRRSVCYAFCSDPPHKSLLSRLR